MPPSRPPEIIDENQMTRVDFHLLAFANFYLCTGQRFSEIMGTDIKRNREHNGLKIQEDESQLRKKI